MITWQRGLADVHRGIIRLGRTTTYELEASADLLFALLAVHTPHQAIKFIARWGLLHGEGAEAWSGWEADIAYLWEACRLLRQDPAAFCAAINERLPEHQYRPENGHLVASITAGSLLGAAYLALLNLSLSGARLGTCDDCGNHFIVEDPRQRYCNRLCGGNARMQRWLDRHRGTPPLDSGRKS